MPRSSAVSLLLILLWTGVRLWAQSAAPPPVAGQMLAPALKSAAGPSNVIAGSYSLSTAYDDNLLNASPQRRGGTQYFLAASIAFQQTREHWKWSLSYRPSMATGSDASWGNQLNQAFGTGMELSLTRRLSVRLRQDYMRTTDPFDHFAAEPLPPPAGPQEGPNDVVVLPEVRRTAAFSGAAITYQLSRRTAAGVTGSYASQRYTSYQTTDWGSALLNSRASTGGAFLARQFSRRYSSGVEYVLLDLRFPDRNMGTRTHGVLWFQQFVLSAGNSLAIFAGPQFSRNQQRPGEGGWGAQPGTPANSWSPALGATYTYQQRHSSLQASYTQGVNDGGGYLGAVNMRSASLSVSRQFARRWTTALSLEGAQETPVFEQQGSEPGSRLRVLRTGLRVNRQIGAGMSCGVAYDRLYQRGRLLGYASGNHNRLMFTFQHSFAKPLGR